MKSWPALTLFFALAAILSAGLFALFHSEFEAGELYPPYSSLRADPRGAKLLYASLSRLPELQVTRNYLPFDSLTASGATLLLLSADPVEVGVEAIEKAAANGNRVVVSFPDDFSPDAAERWGYRHWHLRFPLGKEAKDHGMFFQQADGWSVLETEGDRAVAIEKPFGKGTVALFARSAAFSNASVADADDLDEAALALKPSGRVIFDESHLGVAETGSIVGLARRFRLLGFAAGLAIVAVLFIWRSAAAFPPAPEGPSGGHRAAPAASGLRALLRRHIPPRDLIAACWKEWQIGRRRAVPAQRAARAAEAAKTHAAEPVAAAREIYQALHSKGEL